MAIFKKTEAKKTVAPKKEAKKESAPASVSRETNEKMAREGRGLSRESIIVRPHVTEKATDLSEKGVYVFLVHARANKSQVAIAVEKLYKVKPRKVAIVVTAPKLMKNRSTNRSQVKKAGAKKALVYLKKGDKIEFA